MNRLKTLRKTLGLTQAQMGAKLAIKQNSYSVLENSTKIDEKNIALICASLNVNENWLRYGKGEMFVVTDKTIVDEIVERYEFGDLERKILEVYIALPKENRAVITDYISRIVDSVGVSQNPTQQGDATQKTEILKIANSKDHQVQPSVETVDESEIDALFNLPDTDQH